MALAHKTVVGGIHIVRSGDANVLIKLIVADGSEEFSEADHRFSIAKRGDVVSVLTGINAALTEKGRQPIGAKAGLVIKNTLEACWSAMDA